MVSICEGSATMNQLVTPTEATASRRGSMMRFRFVIQEGQTPLTAVWANWVGNRSSKPVPSSAAGASRYFGTRFRYVPLGPVTTRILARAAVRPASASALVVLRFLWVAWNSATPSAMLALRSEEHTSELQSLRHLVCRL